MKISRLFAPENILSLLLVFVPDLVLLVPNLIFWR